MKLTKIIFTYILTTVSISLCAQPEGKFYVYNPSTHMFLSRATTKAALDNFGLPVEITASGDTYAMKYMDNGASIAASDMPDIFKALGQIAAGETSEWQLLDQKERDNIISQFYEQQITTVASKAGWDISKADDKWAAFDEKLKTLTSADMTSSITNPTMATNLDGWTQNILAGGGYLAYKSSYPMTLYQNSAVEVSQKLSGLPKGIYRATIQSVYRSAKREYLADMYDQSTGEGWSICNAYLAANDHKALSTEWATIRTSSTLPYSRGDFGGKLATDPKYTSTVWVYVDNGTLDLKYVAPSINSTGGDYDLNWFVFSNVTLTRYYSVNSDLLDILDTYNDLVSQAADASTYEAFIEEARQKINDGIITSKDLTTLKADLRAQALKLIKSQPAKSGQYDLTSFINNPAFDNGIKGWTSVGSKFTSSGGIVELYNVRSMTRLYQTLKDMPAGKYTLKVQGFYRACEMKQAITNYDRGKDDIKAELYFGTEYKTPLLSIFDDGCYMLKGISDKSADVYSTISGRGFPHSHYIGSDRNNPIKTPQLASQTFQHGHYWNTLEAELTEDGNFVIGVNLLLIPAADNWIALDNFRLYYGTPQAITIAEGEPLPVSDKAYAPVVLKHQFKADMMTPLAVPCDIPASLFKAVYGIGSLDETTQTATLYPLEKVSANVPCYVVPKEDADQITIPQTMIDASSIDQIPALWDGGLIYRVDDTFTWRTATVSEKQYDATHFTNYIITDPMQMKFTANIENFRVRQYLDNTSYPEPETPSVIANYFNPAPARLDVPHSVGIPLTRATVGEATVRFSLNKNLTDAQERIVIPGSDICYIPNLIPGNTYYYQVTEGEDILAKGQFDVEGPVRMIYAPSVSNIRDIGGWDVQDGLRVRYGLIYRGGELNGLHPSNEADREVLKALGVGAEVDLRKDNNYDSGRGEVGTCAFGFPASDYFFREGGYDCKLEHLTNAASKKRYKEWFKFFIDHLRQGKAVYYHCVWGADRTGLVSVLLEGLLGFSQEQMNKEYELTSLSFAGLRPKSGYADGDHQKLIEKIKTYEGATLRDKFDTYWTQEVGVTKSQIEEFRSLMLYDPNAAEENPLDVNHDGNVDTQDVLSIYTFMQSAPATIPASQPEDVNHDGSVDTQDVLGIYEYMEQN